MANELTILVAADPDADDCLADAQARYIARYPELRGWDLQPRWADNDRWEILLTVPTWSRPAETESA